MRNEREGRQASFLVAEGRSEDARPSYKAKRVDPTIRKPHGKSKREGGKPYFAGGPRISGNLLRRLDILSRVYHHKKTDLLCGGIYNYFLEEVEWEIVHDRGGIFDDR